MKKAFSVLLMLVLCVGIFAGCAGTAADSSDTDTAANTSVASEPETSSGSETSENPVTMRIGGLTGPTSIGMVKLMEDDSAGATTNDYEFTVAGSADELTPKLIQGELDIAAIPANLASVLYNNTEGKIDLLAINTLGVTYIVENGDSVKSIADLSGKTIYATGKGSVPEYTLRYILDQNGIDPDNDVVIEWKSEPAEIVAVLASAENSVAMLPQPYVTVAQTQVPTLRSAIDLTAEWDSLDNGSSLITGVLVIRKDFAEANPEAVVSFLNEYKASTEYANSNVSDAAVLVEKYGITKAAVAEKAIPYCNITYIAGAEMKDAISGYYQILFDQNPASVGGTIPSDDFYYES